MVGKVKFAITHEETRFQLNGALLKVQPNKMEMVATDGHRMALINFPSGITGKGKKGTDLTILVPRKALDEILRLEGGRTERCSSASRRTSSSSKPAIAACWRA
jgi:DNA polymerase-3 subunit beta